MKNIFLVLLLTSTYVFSNHSNFDKSILKARETFAAIIQHFELNKSAQNNYQLCRFGCDQAGNFDPKLAQQDKATIFLVEQKTTKQFLHDSHLSDTILAEFRKGMVLRDPSKEVTVAFYLYDSVSQPLASLAGTHPDYRRKGLFTWLLKEYLRTEITNGKTTIDILVHPNNYAMQKLLTSLGFKPTNKVSPTDLRMHLDLKSKETLALLKAYRKRKQRRTDDYYRCQ